MGEVWQMKAFFSISAAYDAKRRLLGRLPERIITEHGFTKNVGNPLVGFTEHGNAEVIRIDYDHAAPERDSDLMRDTVRVRRPELRIIVIRGQCIRAWPVDSVDVVPYHMVKDSADTERLRDGRRKRSKQHTKGASLAYRELHGPRTAEPDTVLRLMNESYEYFCEQGRNYVLYRKRAALADRDDALAHEQMIARANMRAGIGPTNGTDLILRSHDMRAHGITRIRKPFVGNNKLLSGVRLQLVIHKCPR